MTSNGVLFGVGIVVLTPVGSPGGVPARPETNGVRYADEPIELTLCKEK